MSKECLLKLRDAHVLQCLLVLIYVRSCESYFLVMKICMYVLLFALVLCLQWSETTCSTGDIDPAFRSCAWKCFEEYDCETHSKVYFTKLRSLMHNATSLIGPSKYIVQIRNNLVTALYHYSHSPTCIDTCQYDCSWNITQARRLARPVSLSQYKYHGHWVFLRPFGLQEACSAIFSLLNALPHVIQIAKQWDWGSLPKSRQDNALIQSCGWSKAYFFDAWLRPYPYVAFVTWLASALYHARRTMESHLLDLCMALLLLSYGLLLTFRRILGPLTFADTSIAAQKTTTKPRNDLRRTLSTIDQRLLSSVHFANQPQQIRTSLLLSFVAIGGFFLLWRLYAMCITRTIGYSEHMAVAIPLAGFSCAGWIIWALVAYDAQNIDAPTSQGHGLLFNWLPYGSSRSIRLKMLFFQLLFIAAAMMEIFDFPPWGGLLDAHAAWHACTVPLGFMWYSFLRADAAYLNEIGQTRRKLS